MHALIQRSDNTATRPQQRCSRRLQASDCGAPHHKTVNIDRNADTWTRPAYPDAPHAISELLVHAEHISFADSLAGWQLVQDLVLGTAEGVSQPGDVFFRHMQPLLDLTEAQLLICMINQCSRGTAEEMNRTNASQKEASQLFGACGALIVATQSKVHQLFFGNTNKRRSVYFTQGTCC